LRRGDRTGNQEIEQIEDAEMMENPYDPNQESQWEDEGPDSSDEDHKDHTLWVTLDEFEDQEEGIDPTIPSAQEEY
jgi:hypothetical protein